MSWKISALLLMLAMVFLEVAIKKASDRFKDKALGVFYQYLFCAIIAWLFLAFFREHFVFKSVILVGFLGVANAVGNYFQWQAFALSLSKTSLFLPLSEIVAIVPAVFFLGENALWDWKLAVGIALYGLAIFLFHKEVGQETGGRWLPYTLVLVLIFAAVTFGTKLFADSRLPISGFLVGWYTGCFIGTWLLVMRKKPSSFLIPGQSLRLVWPVSVLLVLALGLLYWTFQLGGPLSQVLPLRGFALSIAPAFLGVLFFKEGAKFSAHQWLGFATGMLAAILIILR